MPDMTTLTGTVLGPDGQGTAEEGTTIACTPVSVPGYAVESINVHFYVQADGTLKTAAGAAAKLPQGSTYRIRGEVLGFTAGANVEIPAQSEYEFRLLVPGSGGGSTSVSQVAFNAHMADTSTHGVGEIVGRTEAQTLTNKTLTAPVINSPTGLVKADVGLGSVDNTSDLNKPVSTAQQAAIDSASTADRARSNHTGTQLLSTISDAGTAASKNTGTAAGDVPLLGSGGKLPSAVVPAIAITDTFVVASQAAMLALSTAETGDVAVRTDLNKSFILAGTDPATLSHWQELLTPPGAVLSVNGQTGVVSLTKADVGLSSVTDDAQAKADFSGYSEKTTPVDADTTVVNDSAAAGAVKRLSWANLKATLKTYFDTVYQAALGFTPLNPANNLSDVASAATSRTNLGLGGGDSPTFTHLIAGGSAPSIAAGAGAGTSPTLSVSGKDMAGVITVAVGTSPSGGNVVVVTVTFASAFAAAPKGVVMTPANAAATGLFANGTNIPFVDADAMTVNSFSVKSGSAALVAGTTYKFAYVVIQ